MVKCKVCSKIDYDLLLKQKEHLLDVIYYLDGNSSFNHQKGSLDGILVLLDNILDNYLEYADSKIVYYVLGETRLGPYLDYEDAEICANRIDGLIENSLIDSESYKALSSRVYGKDTQ